MFYRDERTWVEKLGILDWETKKSLKKKLRKWVVMNVLVRNVGGLRNTAIRLGLQRAASSMKTKIAANLIDWNRPKTRMNPALTFGAAIGAGAGLMYLFDPNRGASRRARFKEGAVRAFNKTGSIAGAASHDLTNRAQGIAARASSFFRIGDTDDATLAARVRSRMGR